MDVEKTIEFLLQNQAKHDAALSRIEAAQIQDRVVLEEFRRDTQEFKRATQEAHVNLETTVLKLQTTVLTLGEHMIQLTKDQIQTQEDLKTQRENLNALIRVVDDLVRRNGGAKH